MARRPSFRWSALASAVTLVAGLLFGTSARVARGTDLRSGRRLRLAELIETERRRIVALDRQAGRLRRDVEAVTALAAERNGAVRAAQATGDRLRGAAGLEALVGPGLVVTLDDAPRPDPGDYRPGDPDGHQPGDPAPDDLVVHEQDVLAVINALWAGGADAVTVMGQRLVATSTVRCVGNTLLLHQAVYSPPFVIAGLGDPDALAAALDAEPGVRLFRSSVEAYGLGYRVEERDRLTAPAYDGPVQLRHGRRATGVA